MIPIIIDGVTCGSLEFVSEGAYVMCRGRARWNGELQRLWLYGSGEPVYLGVLVPDGQGSAAVRKRFTRSEFARLPRPIAYCGNHARQEPPAPKDPAPDTGDVLWLQQPDGTLVGREGQRRVVAFPADDVRLPRGCRRFLREIEGRVYMIFPY